MLIYDIIAAIIVFLIALFVIVRAGMLPPALEATGIGPGSWPAFLGWILMGLSIVLALQAIWKIIAARRREAAGLPSDRPPAPIDFFSPGMRCVYALVALFGVFIAILLNVGFLAGTIVVVPVCMALLGERRWKVLLAYMAGVPVAVYVIFVRILGITLP